MKWVLIFWFLGAAFVSAQEPVSIGLELYLDLVPKRPLSLNREADPSWGRWQRVLSPKIRVIKTTNGAVRAEFVMEPRGLRGPLEGQVAGAFAYFVEGGLRLGLTEMPLGAVANSLLDPRYARRRLGKDELHMASAEECRDLVNLIWAGLRRAGEIQTIVGSLEGDEESVGIDDYEIESWRLGLGMRGSDLGVLGTQTLSVWAGGRRDREELPRHWTSLHSEQGHLWLPMELLETLRGVRKQFAAGRVLRWDSGECSVKAFPENRSIFVRSASGFWLGADGRMVEELRVDMETVREVEKMFLRRDIAVEKFERELLPKLEELMEDGAPGIFGAWM